MMTREETFEKIGSSMAEIQSIMTPEPVMTLMEFAHTVCGVLLVVVFPILWFGWMSR